MYKMDFRNFNPMHPSIHPSREPVQGDPRRSRQPRPLHASSSGRAEGAKGYDQGSDDRGRTSPREPKGKDPRGPRGTAQSKHGGAGNRGRCAREVQAEPSEPGDKTEASTVEGGAARGSPGEETPGIPEGQR